MSMVRRPWKLLPASPERIEQLNKSLLLFEYNRKDALKISSANFLILVATVVYSWEPRYTVYFDGWGVGDYH